MYDYYSTVFVVAEPISHQQGEQKYSKAENNRKKKNG